MGNWNEPNNDINGIMALMDLVVDDIGNYYLVTKTTQENGEYTKLTLSHFYYEKAFHRLFSEEMLNEHRHEHIGVFIQESLKRRINEMNKKDRTIFSISDLINNGIEVSVMKIEESHPRGNKLN